MLRLDAISILAVFLCCAVWAQKQACDQGEYSVNGECCPMCSSGNRVQRHCTSFGSTACIPCVSETYMDHPSGLTECFNCKNCDSGSGLYEKHSCTYTKNTVCGCMPRYYCRDPQGDDCDSCVRHTICVPGFKVVSTGTETSDTICDKCPTGTFSTANMSESCTEWISCHQVGLVEIRTGTGVSNAECSGRKHYALAVAFAFSAPAFIAILYTCCKKKSLAMDDLACKTSGSQLEKIPGLDWKKTSIRYKITRT